MNHKLFIFFIFVFSLFLNDCSETNQPPVTIAPENSSPKKTAPSSEKVEVPVSKDLLLTSLFLSGKLQLEESNQLGEITRSTAYKNFKESIRKNWNQYLKQTLTPLQEWRKKYVPKNDSRVVFYPFSGPDFSNAYYLYPEADTYIMVGLEAGGFEPDIANLPKGKVEQGLREFLSSLDSITRLNFYMTKKMKSNISASIFQGTAPSFLAYFGLMGIRPCSLKSIVLDENGNIQYLTPEDIQKNPRLKKGFVSLEIIFNDPVTGKNKFLYYFSKNISNDGLKSDDSVLKFVAKKGRFVSSFKAASFLVHYAHFSRFRDFILDNADLIVMDDTGPPIKYLKKNFDIKVFGKYTRPIRLWPNMYQSELTELHKQQKPPSISFKYGYGTLHYTQHIMIATRK
jgi:hypothetical protein